MFGQNPNIIDEKVFYCCSDPKRELSKIQEKNFTDTPLYCWTDLPKYNQVKFYK